MLETPVRRLLSLCLSISLAGVALALSSCATQKTRTALISDPDAQKESSIPWNKPAKWETGANIPGGLGGSSTGAGFGGGGFEN